MTIAQRLVVLLVTSIVALLALAGINAYQMKKVFAAANSGNENVIPGIIILDKALFEFGHVRVRLYRHLLLHEQDKKAEVEKHLHEAESLVRKALDDYRGFIFNDEDRSLLEKNVQAFAAYEAFVGKVLSASNRNQLEEGVQLLTHGAATAEHFNEALEAHMTFN